MMILRWICNLINLLILNFRYFVGCVELDFDGFELGGIVLVVLMVVNRFEETEEINIEIERYRFLFI